jgi:nucleotide-binding universal stress UspA family protein
MCLGRRGSTYWIKIWIGIKFRQEAHPSVKFKTIYILHATYILSDHVFKFLDLDAKRNTQKVLNQAPHICDQYNVKVESHVVIGGAKEKICNVVVKLGAQLLVASSLGHGSLLSRALLHLMVASLRGV